MAVSAAFAGFALASAASADSVAGVRVGTTDIDKAEAFYVAAFGLVTTTRFDVPDRPDNPGFKEVIMNFGDTEEAARANTGAQVVIMTRPADEAAGSLAHILFAVDDMTAAVDRATAAGATVVTPPVTLGGGTTVAIVADPDGNQIELLSIAAQ